MSAFFLMGSFGNIQPQSYFFNIFKTYIFKAKSTTRVQLFNFKNAGMFFKTLDRIYCRITVFFKNLLGNFIASNFKTIYITVKTRPEDFRNFVFFGNGCVIFIFIFQCLFSEAWFYGFSKRRIIGNLVDVKVLIKVPWHKIYVFFYMLIH